MKRIASLLLMLLFVLLSSIAEPISWNSVNGGDNGTTSVDLIVDTKKKLREPIVGFTYDSTVSSVDASVTSIGGEGIELTLNRTTGRASNAKPVYFYYQIVSGEKLTISLQGQAPLKGDSLGESVNWYVDWDNKNETRELSMTVETPVTNGIHLHDPQKTTTDDSTDSIGYSDLVGAYGTYEVKITTDNVWEKPADRYSANLYVVITDESGGGN